MQIHRITDLADPAAPFAEGLADYSRLTDVALRRVTEPEGGLYIAESTKVITRALAAGHRPRSVLLQEQWLPDIEPLLEPFPEVPVFVGEATVLESLTGYHLHRGALAAMHRPALLEVGELVREAARGGSSPSDRVRARSRIAILEDLVDHTNVGAAFRSAAALGVDAVLVTPRCADPLYRRAIRVSMGTVFQVPWTRLDPWPAGIELLQNAGYVVAGMTLGEGAITLDELVSEDHPNLALVFGTEGHGMTPGADRRLDRRVTIPMMHGVDSLNVAASSAVAFYATR